MKEGEFNDAVKETASAGGVIHPCRVTSASRTTALALWGEFGGVVVLMCYDLGKLGQHGLFDWGEDLRADLMMTGIPGRAAPLNDALPSRSRRRLL